MCILLSVSAGEEELVPGPIEGRICKGSLEVEKC